MTLKVIKSICKLSDIKGNQMDRHWFGFYDTLNLQIDFKWPYMTIRFNVLQI